MRYWLKRSRRRQQETGRARATTPSARRHVSRRSPATTCACARHAPPQPAHLRRHLDADAEGQRRQRQRHRMLLLPSLPFRVLHAIFIRPTYPLRSSIPLHPPSSVDASRCPDHPCPVPLSIRRCHRLLDRRSPLCWQKQAEAPRRYSITYPHPRFHLIPSIRSRRKPPQPTRRCRRMFGSPIGRLRLMMIA